MRNLVEDFLSYLRHERGQSPQTQKTYAALMENFAAWAEKQGITEWANVRLPDLMRFLEHEQTRPFKDAGGPIDGGPKTIGRLSSETLYLQIAALRAFYRFCETEKHLPDN